jgi:hypothetical protein
VKREAGKASACREQRFEVHQTGDALIQKLLQITFSLEDAQNHLAVRVFFWIADMYKVEVENEAD